jgi:hypothetical protein
MSLSLCFSFGNCPLRTSAHFSIWSLVVSLPVCHYSSSVISSNPSLLCMFQVLSLPVAHLNTSPAAWISADSYYTSRDTEHSNLLLLWAWTSQPPEQWAENVCGW